MNTRFSGKGLSCHRCGYDVFIRVRRLWWMKLIPGSCLYRCDQCSEESWVLAGKKHVESVRRHLKPQ